MRIPIVAGAVIFDLLVGDPEVRPDEPAGYAACEAAADGPVPEGSVGAGTGASVGKFFGTEHAVKGGVDGRPDARRRIAVGAIAVANAVGDVVDAARADRRRDSAATTAGWTPAAR